MARVPRDQPLLPSLIDRVGQADQVLRDLRECLRRDLENLLNTRRRCLPAPPDLEELETSLVN